MSSRGGRYKEYNMTEVQIQFKREEEVIDKESESLPRADDFKPSIKSTNGDNK